MPTTITLTPEEFKLIHNGLCSLRSTTESLSNVLNEKIVDRLLSAQNSIALGLKGAYKQDDEDYTEKSEHYDAIRNDREFKSIWSIYSVSDLLQPHKYPDAKNVVYRTHWGVGTVVVPIGGQSWVDLWAAAEQAINHSGDSHHIYIEKFNLDGDNLELHTGS